MTDPQLAALPNAGHGLPQFVIRNVEVALRLRDNGDAITTFERVRAVDSEFPFSKLDLARALMFGGRLTEAISLFESLEKAGSRLPRRLTPHYLAYAYVMAGRREEAQKLAPTKGSPYSETIFYTAL